MKNLLVVLAIGVGVGVPLGLEMGCGGSTTPVSAAGGSGAFGVVTVNGKQKLYLPIAEVPVPADGGLGGGQIAVVDVGVAASNVDGGIPALIATIDLGTIPDPISGFPITNQATTTAGDSTLVLAAGTQTQTVWFIDPTKDVVIGTLQLDMYLDPNHDKSSFSGGGGVVTGIAIDEAKHRAILSLWNGFLLIDTTTRTISGFIASAPSENFGFDSARDWILAPFYDCPSELGPPYSGLLDGGPPCGSYFTTFDAGSGTTPINSGLNIIDLGKNTVYTFENPNQAGQLADGGTAGYPLTGEPDSASVDPNTGLVVVAEEGYYEDVINLALASFDEGTKTWTAPITQVPQLSLTGAAVEGASHLAFFEGEFSDEVGLVDLSKLGNATGVVDAFMPSTPLGGWSNLGDPHGIAVTTSIQSSSPVGFVVSDDGSGGIWVGRIDLQKMLALGQANNGQLDSEKFAPAVTLLDATKHE